MDIRQLEVFNAVIEHKQVTRAAQALGVTQPAVSAQLARLETELGITLFNRVGRRLQPTTEALLLYEKATDALHGIERLLQSAVEIREQRLGQLTIASHPWAALSLLPEAAANFIRTRPEVKLRLVTRTSDALRDLMESQAFDVGIVEPPIDGRLECHELHRIRCFALLPDTHPLALQKRITPKLLEGQPFIASFRGHQVHHDLRLAFEEAGVSWNVQAEAQFGATIAAMVAHGSGVSVCDPFSAVPFIGRGLVVREFVPEIDYEVAVVHHSHFQPSLLARAFLDELSNQIGAVLDRIQATADGMSS